MTRAARLDAALNGGGGAPDAIRQLVAAAVEVAEALAAERLTAADRARILERSLAGAGSTRSRRSGLRRLSPPRPLLVGGGAAILVGAAAVGWAALRVRRPAAAPA